MGWSFDEKKRLFTMLPPERMRLVTPSKWLADLVKRSFLAKYDVEVVYNTVDTSVFKPTPSDFRERYGIGDRFTVLGVASKWSERKGLQDFVRLVRDLDANRFAVVVIGLSGKQIGEIEGELIALPKTDSLEGLAAAYTAADVFFNPTQEDNFPTVNLEAEACGTPVITYNTGGCAETIKLAESRCIAGFDSALAIIQSMGSSKAQRGAKQDG